MILNNTRFIDALNGLQEFVLDTSADIDMAYDWVCDQAEIGSFVHDLGAWNCPFGLCDGYIVTRVLTLQ